MTSEELEHPDNDAQDALLNSDTAAEETPKEPKVEGADTEAENSDSQTNSADEEQPTTEEAGEASDPAEAGEPTEDSKPAETDESEKDSATTDEPEGLADSEDDESEDTGNSENSDDTENSESDGPDDTEGEEVADDSEQPKRKGKGKKVLLVIGIILLVLIAAGCIFLAVDDNSRTQAIPKITTLDDQVEVSGMTKDELAELLDTRSQGGIASVVSLDVDGTAYDIDLLQVGALDTDNTIKQAYAPYDTFFLARWGTRIMEYVTGNTSKYNIYTAFNIDHEALVARVEEIADEANTDPKNASYKFDSDNRSLVPTPPENGVELDIDATVKAIEQAIKSPSDTSTSRFVIKGAATITEPDELESGQAILVDTSRCRVYLYEAGEEVDSYACTPGQSGYPTPKGDFYLEYKDPAPTWINPHSDWSEGMAETIGPGASNPLGLRALAVSCGGGIYIHGTTNTGGLGSPGSHGCIRLSNSNIVELYDRVSAGIPIIIR